MHSQYKKYTIIINNKNGNILKEYIYTHRGYEGARQLAEECLEEGDSIRFISDGVPSSETEAIKTFVRRRIE